MVSPLPHHEKNELNELNGEHVGQPAVHRLVTTAADLRPVLVALGSSKIVGLDIETTGLDPRKDRTRLLSLSTETVGGGRLIYVVDVFQVNPAPLWHLLAEKELVIHNAAFDLAFLDELGFVPGIVRR